MEGLLIAEELARVSGRLGAGRGAWRFPDPHTFVLPLGDGALWLFNRPPHPRLELLEESAPASSAGTNFQELLAAHAAGALEAASQHKLDRIAFLDFAAGGGFVETPPVRLVFELTGRNCNLILLDREEVILGAAREVRSDVNRYRQIVRGERYRPPPPYEKTDPRKESLEGLRKLLQGAQPRQVPSVLDGIGPQLSRALADEAGVAMRTPLEGEVLERYLEALSRLLAGPSAFLRSRSRVPDVATLRSEEDRRQLQERLSELLERRVEITRRRLADLERTEEAAGDAPRIRAQGDLLLAFPHDVPRGASHVTLEGFDGEPTTLQLDPSKGPAENAQDFFERARKREARARRARERRPQLLDEQERLQRLLERIPSLSLEELRELERSESPPEERERRRGPGIRYRGPHGFNVLVGRNSRENDRITFKVARSRDVWLHAQGYVGSHVIIQSEGREVPFETILFAASLAAGHSKAAESENVPVDYTLRKNVWKVKGQPPGAVHFTRQKTVYVTPSRNPVQERG